MSRLIPRGLALAAAPSVLAVLVGLPLFAGIAAAAPTSAQQAALKSSCQGDYRANCASVPPGGSAALQCLQQNLAKLSPACQEAVTAASGGAAPAPAAPAGDPATAAPADAAAPAAPAPATPAPATPAPKAAKKAAPTAPAAAAAPPPPPMTPRQEMMIVRQYCGADFNRLCSTVRLGGGNGVACLRANAARLSKGCKKALAAAMN